MSKHFFNKYLDLDSKVCSIQFFLNAFSESSVRCAFLKKFPYLSNALNLNIKNIMSLKKDLLHSMAELRSKEINTFCLKDFLHE